MKTIAFAFVATVAAFAAFSAQARAACSTDLRTHVLLGLDFLREAQAYDNRDEDELANAEWENLGHQVELIGGANSPEILGCDDAKLNRDFYLIASWDAARQLRSAVEKNPNAWDPKVHDIFAADARLLRELVSLFNHYGGSTYERGQYIGLKMLVQHYYEVAALPYCSPEQSESACRALEARCPVTERPATLDHAAIPDVPPSVKAVMNGPDVSSDANVVTAVTVSLDAHGNVTDAVVSRSANDVGAAGQEGAALALVDSATVQAAKASTYHPRISGCKGVPGTYIYSAEYFVFVGSSIVLPGNP